MDAIIDTLKLGYLINNPAVVWQRFVEHLQLTAVSMGIALLIALPIGILITRYTRLQGPLLAVLNVLYTVPSIALLVLLVPIPFFGLGQRTAITVLVIYAQVILVRNIVVGLDGVDRSVVEAARGMGMSGWQRLRRVELPLAMPVIIAGIRIATVTTIGIAVVAGLVGAGGLGRLLFEGISRSNVSGQGRIVAGALGAAALAALANVLLRFVERHAARAIYGE
jgi:osmoprotectant transport system permease protein